MKTPGHEFNGCFPAAWTAVRVISSEELLNSRPVIPMKWGGLARIAVIRVRSK